MPPRAESACCDGARLLACRWRTGVFGAVFEAGRK